MAREKTKTFIILWVVRDFSNKMIKLLKFIFIAVSVLGTFYLILPASRNFPYLPNSVKSIEPGDTVQIANVSAYYTDTPRAEVVDFYFRYFSKSPFLGIPLLSYKLNHPPERIREILRDTQQTTYVEEIVHPFRESIFISGFEWNNDPFTAPIGRVKNILIVDGTTYQFKVTLYYQESKLCWRLLIFYLALLAIYFLFRIYISLFQKWKLRR